MPISSGARDLLEYNTQHGVLICRECKYAIQKSALGSHLLRHKIYRGERRRLLSSISQLVLLEPDDVRLPDAGAPPVDGLPIISGYRCTTPGCESLCASSKRMRRHWSECHGVSDPPDSFAKAVHLQTFFRGTKLRYFEVALSEDAVGRLLVTGEERVVEQHDLNLVATPASPVQAPTLSIRHMCELDLEMLKYIHHFTISTSLTLPTENHESAKYWQVDIVEQALRQRWMMCGLLAVSASHLATLSKDEMAKEVHWGHAARFLQDFSAGWEVTKNNSGLAEVEEAKAGAQIFCIQHCCYWTSQAPALDIEAFSEPVLFQLRSVMMTIQGCVYPNFALNFATSSDDVPEDMILQPGTEFRGSLDTGNDSNVPFTLLERLRSLPYRMAEALEKPESARDFFDTLSAIKALVECCSLSYMYDDIKEVWMGMESWLRMLSVHYYQLVRRGNPAALIVLAHWTILVKRAEHHGWFLKGLAAKLLRQISQELPKDRAVQGLIENLTD
jgi:hypothetical protein